MDGMEIGIGTYIAQYGVPNELMLIERVCKTWMKWSRNENFWQIRFATEFQQEYIFLAGKDDGAYQEWRLLYNQHVSSYANGYHLGMDISKNDDAIHDTSLRRWIFVSKQSINNMSRTMNQILVSTPPQLCPLEEAMYWQRNMKHLKDLQDKISETIEMKGMESSNELKENLLTIKKLYNQAQWNAKYFQVLEKPFRDLLTSEMQHIQFIVPAMIKTLKMMWSSSKYYRDCFKMGSLLGRIAHALCARVCTTIDIKTLLHGNDFQDAIDVVEHAGTMLARWHDVYDTSSTFWGPFDVYHLFDRVDYVAQRCSEFRSALVLLRQIRTDMIERVQDNGAISDIEHFEVMLNEMDMELHENLQDVDVFCEAHLQRWLHGVESLRKHSNALLQYVHAL